MINEILGKQDLCKRIGAMTDHQQKVFLSSLGIGTHGLLKKAVASAEERIGTFVDAWISYGKPDDPDELQEAINQYQRKKADGADKPLPDFSVFHANIEKASRIIQGETALCQLLQTSFGLKAKKPEMVADELAVRFHSSFCKSVGLLNRVRRELGDDQCADDLISEFVYLAMSPQKACEVKEPKASATMKAGMVNAPDTSVEIQGIARLLHSWKFSQRFNLKGPQAISIYELPPNKSAATEIMRLLRDEYPGHSDEEFKRMLKRKKEIGRPLALILPSGSDLASLISGHPFLDELFLIVQKEGESINKLQENPEYDEDVTRYLNDYYKDRL